MNFIDSFLNNITMHRLMLYFLRLLFAVALLFSFLGILPYDPLALLAQLVILIASCVAANALFSRIFRVVTNYESAYISALILCLIISPTQDISSFTILGQRITPPLDIPTLIFLVTASVLAMGSKYILAPYHKHIFNPVAFAIVATTLVLNQSASWWIGNLAMLPLVAFGGMLIIRKLRRPELSVSLLVTLFITTILYAQQIGESPLSYLVQALAYSSLLFFAFVMHSEPLTSPPTSRQRVVYGIVVGALLSPQISLLVSDWLALTPEIALLVGNVYSYVVSPKTRLTLVLQEKRTLAKGIMELAFTSPRNLNFKPGQYFEWTLAVSPLDNRGNRRFFTIASSPTEELIRIGVKMFDKPSRFKQTLQQMLPGDHIIASQLAGNFTLPENPSTKLVFIAGGIGVTPFRSMTRYLLDRNEQRDISLYYSVKSQDEIAYAELWQEAQQKLSMRYHPLCTEAGDSLNPELLLKELPDLAERVFYLSGPHAMVIAFETMLADMGIPRKNIHTDYFPGFA